MSIILYTHGYYVSFQQYLSAVRSGKEDIRDLLNTSESNKYLLSVGPRVLRDSLKKNKVTDTEETRELSSILPDGKIITETERTTQHEEVNDEELPEDQPDKNIHIEKSQRCFIISFSLSFSLR